MVKLIFIYFIFTNFTLAKENITFDIKLGSFTTYENAKKISNTLSSHNVYIDKEDFLYKASIKNISSRYVAERVLRGIKPFVEDAYIKQKITTSSFNPPHLPKFEKKQRLGTHSSFDIKIGNFTSLENTKKIINLFPPNTIYTHKEQGIYKLYVRKIPTRKQAEAVLTKIRDNIPDAYIMPHYTFKALPKINHTMTKTNQEILSYWSIIRNYCKNSPTVLLKWYELKELYAKQGIQISEYLPTITLQYMLQSQGGVLTENSQLTPTITNKNLSVNIQQNLYHFGETDIKRDIASIDISLKKEEINLEIESLASQILDYYTQALKEQTKISYTKKMLVTQKSMLQTTKSLIQAGVLSQEELLNQQQALISLKEKINQATLTKTNTLHNLFILINKSYKQQNYLLNMLKTEEYPFLKFEETKLSKMLYLKIQKAKMLVSLKKKNFFPSIDYTGTYNLHGVDVNQYRGENEWRLGLSAKWDLFSGMKDYFNVKKHNIALEKEEQNYLIEKNKYHLEVLKKQQSLHNHSKILSSLNQTLKNDLLNEKRLMQLKKAGRVTRLEMDKAYMRILQHSLNFSQVMLDVKKNKILNSLKVNLWDSGGTT